ncbi:GntR family transcriptional regulator [Rhizobium ruizarguesonis]|jgi:DNA-binding GntR family transcriptional regulator|uniref:GntR family transcriptional regulator n=1 Tax=Rhizobium ruizarguesonis TaxID=2081791 RepID=UPI00103213A0|nr:GntR family transcriptional regulator [Rhizobium ruizarguesonis]MBY5804603.1 GntR family transcriptional regulator [Rhizobium leguminosarum]NKL42427.1 FCD domain-containing protein [Rhizobium leguminosarum bv. viciae]QIO47499.1 GntR family transcriptional regulator [Rhizobium leguminosarum bv. trifolii]MBY5845170.1 GntR family transcriptional regulator [Rhizobium leguminosarum]MBY5887164.1 GntR family transcriptional regulator [Rhizobium leguminosarum]
MDDDIISEIGSPDRKVNLSLTLRRRILTMELPPGAVLDEVALSEEFGLSRPPVRELMRQMAGEGYIELEANRAARVSSMSYQSLHDFFLLAPMIYITANKLAAENGTRGQLDLLKQMQQSFRKAVDNCDVEGRVFYNDQFHRQIGEMAHNVYLVPSLRRLQIDHARIGKVFYKHPNTPRMQEELELATQQHDEMIEAIGKRDPDAAGELARLHLELSRRNMAMYAAPEGLETPTL